MEFHVGHGRHYRLRVPRFGRDIAYHRPSCDLFVVGTSSVTKLLLMLLESHILCCCTFGKIYLVLNCTMEIYFVLKVIKKNIQLKPMSHFITIDILQNFQMLNFPIKTFYFTTGGVQIKFRIRPILSTICYKSNRIKLLFSE